MPTDDEYGRRQHNLQHTSASPATVSCPAGCPAAPVDHHQNGHIVERYHTDRYGSEKNLQDRYESTERYAAVSDRFGSERSNSDRLPSGERYQGVSERYPLGDRPQAAVSSERLVSKDILQAGDRQAFSERFHYATDRRYPDRFTPVQNLGSLDRYHATIDRYSRTSTPTDRYHTLSSDKERCNSNNDRYTPIEKFANGTMDIYTSNDRQTATIERYTPTERFASAKTIITAPPPDVYHHQVRERSGSSDRKSERYQQQHNDRYQNSSRYGHEYVIVSDRFVDRFPTIPCPERFATQDRPDRPERIPFAQVPNYMEPPSPAPASDRFIPPPPLSPINTPSPDCYPSNPFPSPTTTVPPPERFIPPPPLSPSPTEEYSPKKKHRDRYHQDLYTTQYAQYTATVQQPQTQQDRYKDRYYNDRYHNHDKQLNALQDRYSTGERYVPPNAHVPVERYVPQQQQQPQQAQQQLDHPHYGNYQTYDRYQKYTSNNDPYMRRDLGYHYRLPVPYHQNQYQRLRYGAIGTPSRVKCCQYQEQGYQISKSSPSSTSSNSSVTSQQGGGNCIINKETQKDIVTGNNNIQEVQCQNYPTNKDYHQHHHNNHNQCVVGYHHQQEKGVQCNNGCFNKDHHVKETTTAVSVVCSATFASPNIRKGQCRHGLCPSPSVEYVGQSGGRLVCATPPPRGSVSSADISVCSDQCCTRRQNTINLTAWRATSQQSQQQQSQLQPQQSNQQSPQQQQQQIQQQQQQHQQQPQQHVAKPPTTTSSQSETVGTNNENDQQQQSVSMAQQPVSPPKNVQRVVSLPASPPEYRTHQANERRLYYTQSERLPRERPRFARSTSRKEAIKNYIKKETANFFGVAEENEADQQIRWLDRRKRLASRTYGELKDEYREQSSRGGVRRTLSEAPRTHNQSGQLSRGRPDVLPGPSDVPDSSQEQYHGVGLRRKDSVARMTWDGLSYVVTTITRHRPRPRSQTTQWSRSFPPETSSIRDSNSLDDDDVFYERPPPSSPASPLQMGGDGTTNRVTIETEALEPLEPPIRYTNQQQAVTAAMPAWRRQPHCSRTIAEPTRPTIGGSRIISSLLDRVLDNSDRRQYGMGWVGRMFGRSFRKSVAQSQIVQQQLDDMEDYRPMFTYWVTTVQVLVLLISLICYGFGPFGLDLHAKSGQVLVTSLSLQQVDYNEPANFWFGPRAADLIHLGAKFAPCMRVDNKIIQQIDKTRTKERETACCIRNDDSGCVQSSKADCSQTISTWKKWSAGDSGPGGRISGSVCGLDPKYCDAPASVHPYEWPDDITKWPICRKTNTQSSIQKRPKDKSAEHMVCEVIGHPCCIGIHGQCRITTREYCDFVRGTFHEEASLCSQVSCLNDVCGMIPFYFVDTPDQFYRLWTSIFLHAGLLQLLVTILIQHFLMKDLEKLTGSLRIGIIYIGSGVAGNLASAIFVPYRADVGPAGSQFGLLACLIVEVINAWQMLKHPTKALCKLLIITFLLFVIGLLPWVDNYAHLFGFVFGFLLSFALLPFVSFGPYDRHKKVVLIWVCLLSAAFLFICLVLLFYIIPVYDCKICSYFNCVPITADFCATQNINFKREEPVV